MIPRHKKQYFRREQWPEEWIDAALTLIRREWLRYKPQAPTQTATAKTSASSDMPEVRSRLRYLNVKLMNICRRTTNYSTTWTTTTTRPQKTLSRHISRAPQWQAFRTRSAIGTRSRTAPRMASARTLSRVWHLTSCLRPVRVNRRILNVRRSSSSPVRRGSPDHPASAQPAPRRVPPAARAARARRRYRCHWPSCNRVRALRPWPP